ncbi:MAG: hypothetical protein IIC91_03170 [Chloroflexi bacterium]|nr:hypothetical protein [Chloroflexota bacterium]
MMGITVPKAPRIATAALAALAVFALLFAISETEVLGRLPAYLAVFLAFVLVVMMPGLALQQPLLRGPGLDAAVRLIAAVPLGLAAAIVPALLTLEAHLSLHDFGLLHAIAAGMASGAGVLFWSRDEHTASNTEDEPEARGSLLLVVLLCIGLGGVAAVPFWAGDNLEGDLDDWTYMAYVKGFQDTIEINAAEPFLGTGEDVNPRMRDNVWVLVQSHLSDVADVPPEALLLKYLRPILAICAVAAIYAFSRSLFKSATIGLLAAVLLLGYGLIDLSPHEGMGRNLLIRIGEDKMVSAFVMLPLALMFVGRFVERPTMQNFAGFALIAGAMAFVHPVPLFLLAVVLISFAGVRALATRSVQESLPLALLLVPVGFATIWPFIQRQLLVDVAPDLFGTEASSITFRDQFHVIELGGGFIIGNYHMVLHPMMLAAILVSPVVWLLGRRSVANQLLLAGVVGGLAVFFVPVFATPVSEVMTPQTLWKVPWVIPAAPILAYVTCAAMGRLPLMLRSNVVRGVAPSLMAVLVLGGALVAQEQYERFDGGAFYTWTSDETVVPGADRSIFRGGIDRATSAVWRVPEIEREVLDFAGELPPGSVLLIEPSWLQRMIPGRLTDIYAVDYGGTAGEGDRRALAEAFAQGTLRQEEFDAAIDRYGIDYIVVREVQPANDVVRESERVNVLADISPYLVYEVR